MQNLWINLGASKDAPAGLKLALEQNPDATTITTNAGILLLNPTYYFLVEHKAGKLWSEQIKAARQRGTKLICPSVRPSVWQDWNLGEPDYLYTPSEAQADCIYSGLRCTQFALLSGCKRMLLPGHQGYISDLPHNSNGGDYWLTTQVHGKGAYRQTLDCIAPWWRLCVKEHPDVEFVWYGSVNFQVDGFNVRKIPL